MRSLKTRHSWPSLRHPRTTCKEDSVDSDPFAYFISPAEDRVEYIEGSLTAGISNKPRSRPLPPYYTRKPRTILLVSTSSKSPTARLKRWIERVEKQYFFCSRRNVEVYTYRPHQYVHVPDPIIRIIEPRQKPSVPNTKPVIIPISPAVRGRDNARSGSRQRRVGNNSRTPPRRARVWREPSSGIWSVAEEEEIEIPGLGILM